MIDVRGNRVALPLVGVADSLRSARTAARYKQLLSGENREAIFRFVSRLLFAGPER